MPEKKGCPILLLTSKPFTKDGL